MVRLVLGKIKLAVVYEIQVEKDRKWGINRGELKWIKAEITNEGVGSRNG